MADSIVTEKVCTVCKTSKPLCEFDADKRIRRCKECRAHPKNTNTYIQTTCKDCGKVEQRRDDYIKDRWGGRCRSCAMKVNNLDVEMKERRAVARLKTMNDWPQEKKDAFADKSRQQVLRQGGVPNAKKFAKEGENGRRMAGSNHYAWKGGVPNGRYRGFRYKEWHKAVLKRDNYTCQFCGKKSGNLEADHILPWCTHVELRYEVSNGRTLCNPCHRKTDTYGSKALKFKAA